MRRLAACLAVVFALVLSAAPAFAQTGGDPPATGGQSGQGGNVPAAGNTGGGTEAPSAGNARIEDGDGKTMTTIFILSGVAAAVLVMVLRINERRRNVEAGRVQASAA